MEFHLLKIAEASESVRTLYFRPPSIFTNAVITQPEITSLIHDADNSERALFTVPKSSHGIIDSSSVPERRPKNQNSTKKLDIPSLLRDEEWNVDTMCAVIERLASVYPVDGVSEKVAHHRSRWSELNDNIVKYEEIVEEQRQQLSALHLTIESRDFEDVQQDPAEIERQIQEEQEKISQLEQKLEDRQKQVNQLEGKLGF